MKLIYLSLGNYNNKYKSLFKSLNIETIHYKNALKALDNLNEIEPDIFYIKKEDFLRLWKITLTGVREIYDKNSCIFVIEGILDKDEQKAFNFLGGNYINDTGDEGLTGIKDLITQHRMVDRQKIYYTESNELCIGFVKPDDFSFVSGIINEISESKITFTPDNPEECKDLPMETLIQEASISRDSEVVNVNLEITQIADQITCKIVNNQENYIAMIDSLFV